LQDIISHLKSISVNGHLHFDVSKASGNHSPYVTHFSLQNQETIIESWGCDHSEQMANLKAIMELLERYYLSSTFEGMFKKTSALSKATSCTDLQKQFGNRKFWYPQNTSGLAIHTSKNHAIKGAIAEVIERHTLLKAQAERIPGFLIEANFECKRTKTLIWKGPIKHWVAASFYQTENGFLFGFGASRNQDLAARKSILELYPNIYWYNRKNNSFFNHNDGLSKAKEYFLNCTDFPFEMTRDMNSTIAIDQYIKKSDFYFSDFSFVLPKLLRPKLSLIRIVCPKLICHQIGKIDISRISDHFKQNFKIKEFYNVIC
jgi:hypothetical protein